MPSFSHHRNSGAPNAQATFLSPTSQPSSSLSSPFQIHIQSDTSHHSAAGTLGPASPPFSELWKCLLPNLPLLPLLLPWHSFSTHQPEESFGNISSLHSSAPTPQELPSSLTTEPTALTKDEPYRSGPSPTCTSTTLPPCCPNPMHIPCLWTFAYSTPLAGNCLPNRHSTD